MKKQFKTVTLLKMIEAKEVDIRSYCLTIIDRAAAAEENITPYLQQQVRAEYKKDCSSPDCILNNHYQKWAGTDYDCWYKRVNSTQARCRQLIKAAEENSDKAAGSKAAGSKAAGSKAAGSKAAGSSSKADNILTEKAKTAVQKKRADSWSDKAKIARVSLKAVQTSGKQQLKKIASLEKEVSRLEKENSRIKRENNGAEKVYNELYLAVKTATTLEQFQAII